MKRIAVIGAGNMGGAIIRAVKGSYAITAVDKDISMPKKLKVRTAADIRTAVEISDIVIIAVKPQDIDGVLHKMKGAGSFVISIAAGIGTRRIEKALGRVPVVRVMPNTPLLAGCGMSVLCPGRYAVNKHLKEAERIFSRAGKVLIVRSERLMDAVTAVSGSGPAYVYLFIEAMVKAGRKLGLKDDMLVRQTVKGAVALLESGGGTPEELRRKVTSPGGTTEAALKVFRSAGFEKIIGKAVTAAYKRSKDLGRYGGR